MRERATAGTKCTAVRNLGLMCNLFCTRKTTYNRHTCDWRDHIRRACVHVWQAPTRSLLKVITPNAAIILALKLRL